LIALSRCSRTTSGFVCPLRNFQRAVTLTSHRRPRACLNDHGSPHAEVLGVASARPVYPVAVASAGELAGGRGEPRRVGRVRLQRLASGARGRGASLRLVYGRDAEFLRELALAGSLGVVVRWVTPLGCVPSHPSVVRHLCSVGRGRRVVAVGLRHGQRGGATRLTPVARYVTGAAFGDRAAKCRMCRMCRIAQCDTSRRKNALSCFLAVTCDVSHVSHVASAKTFGTVHCAHRFVEAHSSHRRSARSADGGRADGP